MSNQLLSAKELAKLLSVSTRTVWRLRSAGVLPKPVTVGSSVRWRENDISEWIASGCSKIVEKVNDYKAAHCGLKKSA